MITRRQLAIIVGGLSLWLVGLVVKQWPIHHRRTRCRCTRVLPVVTPLWSRLTKLWRLTPRFPLAKVMNWIPNLVAKTGGMKNNPELFAIQSFFCFKFLSFKLVRLVQIVKLVRFFVGLLKPWIPLRNSMKHRTVVTVHGVHGVAAVDAPVGPTSQAMEGPKKWSHGWPWFATSGGPPIDYWLTSRQI